MGPNDRLNERKAEKRLARKRRATTGNGSPTDWEQARPELVIRLISTIAKMGGAVRFSYTRDGGAYCIGVYGDGEPFSEYARPGDDLDSWLQGLIEDYND
jgi:hypothetical protein